MVGNTSASDRQDSQSSLLHSNQNRQSVADRSLAKLYMRSDPPQYFSS